MRLSYWHSARKLDALDEMMQRVEEANRSDPELSDGLKVTYDRALRGVAEADDRLDAAPNYANVECYCYGRNGVQAFVETDVLTGGPPVIP